MPGLLPFVHGAFHPASQLRYIHLTPDRRRLRPRPGRTVRRGRVQTLPHPPRPQPLSHLCPLAYLSQPQPSRPKWLPPLRWPRLRPPIPPPNRTVIQTRARRARRRAIRRRAPRAPIGRMSSPGGSDRYRRLPPTLNHDEDLEYIFVNILHSNWMSYRPSYAMNTPYLGALMMPLVQLSEAK
jgi:hypothetical protein